MKYIIIKNKQDVLKLPFSDIYYIITHPVRPHYLQVFTENEVYDLLGSLTKLANAYPNKLVRCHRNCLVNVNHIKEIHLKEKKILLGQQGQLKVLFSRRRYRNLLQLWLKDGKE